MIKMKGTLKMVVAEVEDIIVDLEDEAVVAEEVISLAEHALHVDHLTTTGANVL